MITGGRAVVTRNQAKPKDLDLHALGRGVAFRADSGVQILADPFRHRSH